MPGRAFVFLLMSLFSRTVSAQRSVAVTFDDLPATRFSSAADAREITHRLFRHIQDHRMPAIGFVNERKLEASPELPALLEAWLDQGLALGNHTYSHLRLPDHPLDSVEADVLRGERVTRRLLAARGNVPRWFRHPTLNTGPDSATRAAFERFLAGHGYAVAPVTIDNDEYLYALAYDRARAGGDSARMSRLGRDYVDYMARMFAHYESLSRSLLGREPAQVLLLHANALNADWLGRLATMIRGRGYRFISIEEALEDTAYRLPDRYIGRDGPSWLVRWAVTRGLPVPGTPAVPRWVRESGR